MSLYKGQIYEGIHREKRRGRSRRSHHTDKGLMANLKTHQNQSVTKLTII